MRAPAVYIDTSVIGGCFDPEFQQESTKLFDLIDKAIISGYCSKITLNEIENFLNLDKQKHLLKLAEKLKVLPLNQEAIELSAEYLREGILSPKSLSDAQHIAIASVNNLDVIVSWNFKHIVNFRKIPQFNLINLKLGYRQIEIRSPQEIIYSYE
ncbi:MAG: PIN domain-containing protein [Candidatus Caenarcaniphilales bacterium]|nr:PIN domain-containing protein [Candidatus Caenarcaniphilales bacterium]